MLHLTSDPADAPAMRWEQLLSRRRYPQQPQLHVVTEAAPVRGAFVADYDRVVFSSAFRRLLLVAMPLKYLAGQTDAVRYVGMAHGLLFVLYALLVLQNAIESSWSWRKAGLALLASLVPLGTFWADKRLFRE